MTSPVILILPSPASSFRIGSSRAYLTPLHLLSLLPIHLAAAICKYPQDAIPRRLQWIGQSLSMKSCLGMSKGFMTAIACLNTNTCPLAVLMRIS